MVGAVRSGAGVFLPRSGHICILVGFTAFPGLQLGLLFLRVRAFHGYSKRSVQKALLGSAFQGSGIRNWDPGLKKEKDPHLKWDHFSSLRRSRYFDPAFR